MPKCGCSGAQLPHGDGLWKGQNWNTSIPVYKFVIIFLNIFLCFFLPLFFSHVCVCVCCVLSGPNQGRRPTSNWYGRGFHRYHRYHRCHCHLTHFCPCPTKYHQRSGSARQGSTYTNHQTPEINNQKPTTNKKQPMRKSCIFFWLITNEAKPSVYIPKLLRIGRNRDGGIGSESETEPALLLSVILLIDGS